jgi:hypothetical protein
VWLRLFAIACALIPAIAHADMVWPALYLVSRLVTWWAVVAGLLIEYIVIRVAFKLPPKKAVFADLAANAASSIVGSLLIAIAGIAWEFGPGLAMYHLLNVGTFNPVTWAATIAMGALINAGIEMAVLRAFQVPATKRTFLVLTLANALTVGIAFGSMFIVPVET